MIIEKRRQHPPHSADTMRLVHEVDVYKAEVELQNEELHRARLEVEAGLHWYAALFDYAPIGYATVGIDGRIKELNHEGAELLGGAKDAFVDRPFEQIILLPVRREFDRFWRRVLQSGSREVCELPAQMRKNTSGYLRVTAAILEYKQKVLLAFEDITKSKQREFELAHAESSLREVNKRKDEFISMLSHELRNPLAPIRSSIYVLNHCPPGTERAVKAQATIERQVAHLTRLVDDLLDMTRTQCGKVQLRKETVELRALVQRTVDDHRPNFSAKCISLDMSLGEADIYVHVDPVRIVQAISNILTNAAKFTGNFGWVNIVLERCGDDVTLHVKGNGPGIAFAQGPQSFGRSGGGLGLGLAIVKGLVEMHSGSVHIGSRDGGYGTDACIRLPTQASRALLPTDAAAAAKRRVLIVEDNQDAAKSLQSVLELDGHEVSLAYNGVSGIQLAKSLRPDVVICDIGLPGLTGYSVARSIRQDPSTQSIFLIALSGYAQVQDLEDARVAGFDRHLAKPPSLDEIKHLLNAVRRLEH